MATPLLEIRDLRASFRTDDGVVQAVDGVSATLYEGETLGIVGESGSGKSVTMMTVMRLITDPNARFEGEVLYKGTNLMDLPQDRIRSIRGAGIGMIFQDPMTSLNPVYKVGWQIAEQIREHEKVSKQAAHARAVELLTSVGIPNPAMRVDAYPHQFSGGMRQRVMIAMAICLQPGPAHRRRADDGAGRDHPGADPEPDQEAARGLRHRGGADHPRHGRGGRHGRPDRGDVRRPHRRAGHAARALLRPAAPVHLGPARVDRPAGPAQTAAAGRDSRTAAVTAAATGGLRVRGPVHAPVRAVRRAPGAARPDRRRPPRRLPPVPAAETARSGLRRSTPS